MQIIPPQSSHSLLIFTSNHPSTPQSSSKVHLQLKKPAQNRYYPSSRTQCNVHLPCIAKHAFTTLNNSYKKKIQEQRQAKPPTLTLSFICMGYHQHWLMTSVIFYFSYQLFTNPISRLL